MERVFYPVIHVEDKKQGIEQVALSLLSGADGVFLINHSIPYFKLFDIYKYIRIIFPKAWIGINCLGLDPLAVIKRMPKDINGLWVDNPYIYEVLGYDDQEYGIEVLELIEEVNWNGLYFGGVAFKYQRKVKDLTLITSIASRFMDVITTSGPGTGIAPSVEKIKIMSRVAHKNKRKLAIASGISLSNVRDYTSADIFMVATGISYDFTHLNPELIKRLQLAIKFKDICRYI